MTSYDTLDDLQAELARARFDLERSLIGADNARIRIRDLEADIRDMKRALDPQQEAAREGTTRSDAVVDPNRRPSRTGTSEG